MSDHIGKHIFDDTLSSLELFGDIKNFSSQSSNLNCSNIKDYDKTSSDTILALEILKIKNNQRFPIANSFSITTSFSEVISTFISLKLRKNLKPVETTFYAQNLFRLIWYFSVLMKKAYFYSKKLWFLSERISTGFIMKGKAKRFYLNQISTSFCSKDFDKTCK